MAYTGRFGQSDDFRINYRGMRIVYKYDDGVRINFSSRSGMK